MSVCPVVFLPKIRNIKLRVIPMAVFWVTPLPLNKVGNLRVDSCVSILHIMSVTVIGWPVAAPSLHHSFVSVHPLTSTKRLAYTFRICNKPNVQPWNCTIKITFMTTKRYYKRLMIYMRKRRNLLLIVLFAMKEIEPIGGPLHLNLTLQWLIL